MVLLCKKWRRVFRKNTLKKIEDKEIIIIKESEKIIGWLRYSLFWDNIPFMNMLRIEERYRKKGLGRLLVEFWEKEMREKGHKLVLTSTMSNEFAQHFYRKLGYKDAGCLLLEEEGLEIVFKKEF
ncbi:GNAT family N-acetyltransferase [Isachenkonia alkalipeptolytica]|uniref:GNAT family N-acetyltransferase n=1 Tax=Isachenkonia alkalipeptolytica TaxID=2565777 RepID=A0AA44BEH8_9CLOT|nr:GNAT family N-acetyltransferase [Isachenkonia alkalipeptolytica]